MKAERLRSSRSAFVFSILLYVIAAFAYSWLMPPWEAPDEPAHYVLAANLARIGKFSSIEVNYEAHQPQPYYRLMSVPLELLYNRERSWIDSYRPESNYNNIRTEAPIFEWDAENYRFVPGLYTLRWINVLIGAAAVAVNAVALRRLFPESPRTALAAAIFLAFIPQFLHISSAVANDTLASLGGAILFWALVRIATGPPNVPGYLLAAGAAAALPLGTKLSAIPMGIAVVLAIGLKVRATRGISWWAVAAGVVGLAGLVTLAGLALPSIGRMWLRVIPGRVIYVFEGAFEPETIRMMLAQLAGTFWGQVGWIGAGLPGWMVALLTGLAAVGFGSTVLTALRERGDPQPGRDWALIAAGIALAIVLRNGFFTIANQGRLLFPALGPIAFAVMYGWSRLVPERVRGQLPWIVGGIWLVVNLWLIFEKIVPIYFQPGLDN
jgi:hypothetical protein